MMTQVQTEGTAQERLFIGITPTGIKYADREVEDQGDYKVVAFLPFDTLKAELRTQDKAYIASLPPAFKARVNEDVKAMRAKAGQEFAIDASGHTVRLGTKLDTWAFYCGRNQQAKVERALKAIRSEGQSYTEKTGIIGVREHETSFCSPFSPPHEGAVKAMTALGQLFWWTVTRDNHTEVIEAAQKTLGELLLIRPIDDKRVTPEAHAAAEAENQARVEKARRNQTMCEITDLQTRERWADTGRDQIDSDESATDLNRRVE
jgi:hypothetical protein